MSVFCEICNEEFINNKGGQLSSHVVNIHKISIEEYVVITKYDGVSPLCECGYCNNSPTFSRGVFKRYYNGHNTFKWRTDKYVEINGEPKCILCSNNSGFTRIKPNILCTSCHKRKYSSDEVNILSSRGLLGFCSNDVQNRIKESVMQKYGVDNVSKLEHVKHKISTKLTGVHLGRVDSENTRAKKSNASKIMWNSDEFRLKTIPKIIIGTNTEKEKLRRSEYSLNRIKNESGYLEFLIDTLFRMNNRSSKLHLKVVDVLDLKTLGYVSEYKMYPYVYDEVNLDTKTVIEINGDYVHANPTLYSSDAIIRLPNVTYSADDKWKYDAIKRKHAEDLGFKYIVIWESDLKNDIGLSRFKDIVCYN